MLVLKYLDHHPWVQHPESFKGRSDGVVQEASVVSRGADLGLGTWAVFPKAGMGEEEERACFLTWVRK